VGPDLWTNPTNIYDALQVAIIDPIVSLSETVLSAYGRLERAVNDSPTERPLPKLYRVPFDVPIWEAPHILEWSYSNALTLWSAGYEAGKKFAAALGDKEEIETYRYYQPDKQVPRTTDLLKLFDAALAARFRPDADGGRDG
jgi:hypothetical protein